MNAPATAAELRRAWDSGDRVGALRGALDNWEALLSSGADLLWLERALRTSGLPVESTALQVHMARRQPADEEAWERLVESILHSGDPWWAHALLAEHGASTRRLQALRVEIDLALGDAAEAIAAWERAHDDEAARDAAVGWWIAAGRVEEAQRLLAAHPGLELWRARLALWRGDTDAARAHAAALPESEETRYLAAAAAVLEGDLGAAEPRLRELTQGDFAAQAWSWLATLLRRQGRYEEARQAADAANVATPAFALAPRLERELSTEYECVGPYTASRSPLAWLRRRLRRSPERVVRDLEYADLLYPFGLGPWDPLGKLEAALDALGGNRTATPTIRADGGLRSLHLPIDPRHFGATMQVVLWTRGLEALRDLYREMGPRVGNHPLFEIYRGEIELWMGEYAAAERIFRTVIDRHPMTRWAWIGLGGALMQQGDLAGAQKIWAEGVVVTNFEGPTLFVLRGECWRRQGEVERARRDLEEALRQKPQRLSARINLALLDDDAARIDEALRHCQTYAPILMAETPGSRRERLEGVLRAMRGNRSSSSWLMSYHLWGRVWRRAG